MKISTAQGAALLAMAAGALAGGGCGSSPSSSTGSAAGAVRGCAEPGVATATTTTYRMVVNLGPVEAMYSEQDAASKHPAAGEVMLGGAMSDATGPMARHLEVHICRLADDTVVVGANPTLMLTDTATHDVATSVPIGVMRSVTAGTEDLHYGNNVGVRPGDAYRLVVSLNGESATLTFTAS